MKVAILVSLLFASTFAVKDVYLCGVVTQAADNFPDAPTLKGSRPAAFNALSFGSFYSPSGDVEGAAAVRNNVDVDNYSFGYELITSGVSKRDEPMAYSLIAGGNVNWPGGAIYPQGNNVPYAGAAQKAYVGGSLSTTSNIPADVNQGDLNAQFDAVQAYYVQVQNLFAALPANCPHTTQWSGTTFSCPTTDATLWTVSMTGAEVSATTYWTLSGCNADAQFNIIITGTDDVTFQGDNIYHNQNNIIYNIVGSGRVINVLTEVRGNLLAPTNVYNQPGRGVWKGLVIAGDLRQVLQINRDFCPTPPAPLAPSPCLVWETACAGLQFTAGSPAETNSFVHYNAISFGNFVADTGDVEGRLAVKGDVTLGTGYSIGAVLSTVNDMPDVGQVYSLIAGGDVNWGNGALFPVDENAFVHGSYANIPADVSARTTAAGDLTALFSSAESCYCAMSQTLAAQAQNVQYTIQYTGLFVTCDDATADVYTLNIAGSAFSQFTYYSLANCNFQSRWVINVNGDADITGDSFPAPAGAVVYNVLGTSKVSVHDTALVGSVLGCDATLDQPTGVIIGKVVVRDVIATRQINLPICVRDTTVVINVVASASSAAGSTDIEVVAGSNIVVGDQFGAYTVVAINGNTVTVTPALSAAVSQGDTVGKIYTKSSSGRGKIANPTMDADSSSASTVAVATLAVAAALLF